MEGEYFSTLIKSKQLPRNLGILTLEKILDGMKILLVGLYKPPSFNEKDFLFHLNNIYNLHHLRKYNVDRPFQYVTRKKN